MKQGLPHETYGALARPCTSDNSHALTSFELQVDIGEDVRSIRVVPNRHLPEFDLTGPRPVMGDHTGRIIRVTAALFWKRLVVFILGHELDVFLDSVKLK